MIISCPECGTKYAVKSESIGMGGRDVRCARCTHSWFQTLPEDLPPTPVASEEPQPRAVPKGSSLPVAIPVAGVSRGLMWSVGIAGVLVILFSAIMLEPFILRHFTGMAPVYNAVGLYDTSGIALANIKIEKVPSERYDTYSIQGMIMNEGKSSRIVPTIRITFTDKRGIPITSWDFSQSKTVSAGKNIPFRADKLEVVSTRHTYAIIELGNPIELAMRN